MSKIFLLILCSEFWNTLGQILFKKATNALEKPHLKSFHSTRDFVTKILGMPGIWLGLGSMAVGLVIWLVALAQSDLSLVFPIGSVQYLLILVGARLFLGERIDTMKWVGTLLVAVGIVLITIS